MTLSLILPKIYLLKCHLQENKTDTLSFLHLHFKQAQEHLALPWMGLLPSPVSGRQRSALGLTQLSHCNTRQKIALFTIIQNIPESNYSYVLKGSLTLTYERQCLPR